jgi:hypothetical protein
VEIYLKENHMEPMLRYKVLDVSPDESTWTTQMEDVINQQAREGWELVSGFQRQHEAQQVGSTTVHVSSLVSTVLVFKRPG